MTVSILSASTSRIDVFLKQRPQTAEPFNADINIYSRKYLLVLHN